MGHSYNHRLSSSFTHHLTGQPSHLQHKLMSRASNGSKSVVHLACRDTGTHISRNSYRSGKTDLQQAHTNGVRIGSSTTGAMPLLPFRHAFRLANTSSELKRSVSRCSMQYTTSFAERNYLPALANAEQYPGAQFWVSVLVFFISMPDAHRHFKDELRPD